MVWGCVGSAHPVLCRSEPPSLLGTLGLVLGEFQNSPSAPAASPSLRGASCAETVSSMHHGPEPGRSHNRVPGRHLARREEPSLSLRGSPSPRGGSQCPTAGREGAAPAGALPGRHRPVPFFSFSPKNRSWNFTDPDPHWLCLGRWDPGFSCPVLGPRARSGRPPTSPGRPWPRPPARFCSILQLSSLSASPVSFLLRAVTLPPGICRMLSSCRSFCTLQFPIIFTAPTAAGTDCSSGN